MRENINSVGAMRAVASRNYPTLAIKSHNPTPIGPAFDGTNGDYLNGVALVRRDRRRCNFVCLYIFCNGQVGNNCQCLFRCSQNNCEYGHYFGTSTAAHRGRALVTMRARTKTRDALHRGEGFYGRHHRWDGVDV